MEQVHQNNTVLALSKVSNGILLLTREEKTELKVFLQKQC